MFVTPVADPLQVVGRDIIAQACRPLHVVRRVRLALANELVHGSMVVRVDASSWLATARAAPASESTSALPDNRPGFAAAGGPSRGSRRSLPARGTVRRPDPLCHVRGGVADPLELVRDVVERQEEARRSRATGDCVAIVRTMRTRALRPASLRVISTRRLRSRSTRAPRRAFPGLRWSAGSALSMRLAIRSSISLMVRSSRSSDGRGTTRVSSRVLASGRAKITAELVREDVSRSIAIHRRLNATGRCCPRDCWCDRGHLSGSVKVARGTSGGPRLGIRTGHGRR